MAHFELVGGMSLELFWGAAAVSPSLSPFVQEEVLLCAWPKEGLLAKEEEEEEKEAIHTRAAAAVVVVSVHAFGEFKRGGCLVNPCVYTCRCAPPPSNPPSLSSSFFSLCTHTCERESRVCDLSPPAFAWAVG